MWVSMNALMPAIPICASEIWPTYPVMITTEKQMQAVISEESSAARYWALSTSSARIPHDHRAPPAVAAGRGGRPTAGLWTSVIVPRADRRRASTMIASMMMMNGRPSCRPVCGSHDQTLWSLTVSDWSMPIARPRDHHRAERGEAAEQRGAERRDDEQRVGARIERRDRQDQDPGGGRQHRREHPVVGGDTGRRMAEQRRAALVLDRRPGDLAKARVPVHRPPARSRAGPSARRDTAGRRARPDRRRGSACRAGSAAS